MYALYSAAILAINGLAGASVPLDQILIWVSSLGVPIPVALVALQWWRRKEKTFVHYVFVASGLSFLPWLSPPGNWTTWRWCSILS
jgi:hypothetical protein